MTPQQFDAIAKLTGSRGGAAEAAARLALVDRIAPLIAAQQAGCSPQSASNAIRRYRDAAELIDSAWESNI